MPASKNAAARLSRVQLAFGLDDQPWIEERTLERYELLYEAGLAPEATRDSARRTVEGLPARRAGEPMISDHRRILATAIGRLRGKIKYRPVVFELMPEKLHAARPAEGRSRPILGLPLHKQNFRRSLDRSGLVVGLEQFTQATGGRPAELFRFRREALREGHVAGVQTPRS